MAKGSFSDNMRILHVASRYSQYENTNPSALLAKIHNDMKREFDIVAKSTPGQGMGNAAEANELQMFFQEIKMASSNFGNMYLDSIEDTMKRNAIAEIVSASLKATGFSTLFRSVKSNAQVQGMQFEKQLNAVIASTLNLASGKSMNAKAIQSSMSTIGMGTKGASLNAGFVDLMAEDVTKTVIDNFLTKKNNKNNFSKMVLAERSAKIDSSGKGFIGEITVSPTSYLYRIANLLRHASFTAKSYASQRAQWISTIKMKVMSQATNTALHLGSTESARVFLSVLGSHVPPPVALSMYMYIMNTSNQSARLMASRIRFIYELTGYGQQYKDRDISKYLGADATALRANYIIYNDPATNNIFVRSTADIILELWDIIGDTMDQAAIKLEKSLFK